LSRGGRRGLCAALLARDALGVACVRWGIALRAHAQVRPRTLRSCNTACRHLRPVWEPARSNPFARAWNSREVGVAIRFARFGQSRCFGASLTRFVGKCPAGRLHVPRLSPRSADADPPRSASPAVLEEPEPKWTNLWRPCRLAGTDHRLQPTHRCPTRARTLRCSYVRGFTCLASSASRPPGKGRSSDDAGRLKRYREYLRYFHNVDADSALKTVENFARNLRTRSPVIHRRSASVAGSPQSERRCIRG